MAKTKDMHIYAGPGIDLNALAADYEFLGREVKRGPGVLTVLAFPSNSLKKQREAAKAASKHDDDEDDEDEG